MKQSFNKGDIILAAISLAINVVMLSICIMRFIDNNTRMVSGILVFGFLTLFFSIAIIIMQKNLKKD